MALKQYKPTTNGRRGMTSQDFSDITTRTPLKSLIKIKKTSPSDQYDGHAVYELRSGR